MPYKFCYNCGAKLKEDAIYCGECGAKQEVDSNAPEQENAINETVEPQYAVNETTESQHTVNETVEPQTIYIEEQYEDNYSDNESNEPTSNQNLDTDPNNKFEFRKNIPKILVAVVVVVGVLIAIIISNNNSFFESETEIETEMETEALYTVSGKYVDNTSEEDNYFTFNDTDNTYKGSEFDSPKEGTYTIDGNTGKIELDDNTVMYTDNEYVYNEELSGDAVADYTDQELVWMYTDTEDNDAGSADAKNTYMFEEDGTVTEYSTFNYSGQTIPLEYTGTYTVDTSTGLFTLTFDEDDMDQTMICKDGKMYYHVYEKE